jgi:hypothetical protein
MRGGKGDISTFRGMFCLFRVSLLSASSGGVLAWDGETRLFLSATQTFVWCDALLAELLWVQYFIMMKDLMDECCGGLCLPMLVMFSCTGLFDRGSA